MEGDDAFAFPRPTGVRPEAMLKSSPTMLETTGSCLSSSTDQIFMPNWADEVGIPYYPRGGSKYIVTIQGYQHPICVCDTNRRPLKAMSETGKVMGKLIKCFNTTASKHNARDARLKVDWENPGFPDEKIAWRTKIPRVDFENFIGRSSFITPGSLIGKGREELRSTWDR